MSSSVGDCVVALACQKVLHYTTVNSCMAAIHHNIECLYAEWIRNCDVVFILTIKKALMTWDTVVIQSMSNMNWKIMLRIE